MEITPAQLVDLAGQLALELRVKDTVIAQMERRIAELEDQLPASGDAEHRKDPATAA